MQPTFLQIVERRWRTAKWTKYDGGKGSMALRRCYGSGVLIYIARG